MAESPFTLTVRQAVRILVECWVLTILTCVGVVAVSSVLQRFAGLDEPGEWEWVVGSLLGSIWVISRALRRHGLMWSQVTVWRVQPGGLVAPFLILIIGVGILLSGVDNVVEAIAPTPAWIRELLEELTDPARQPIAGFFVAVIVAPLTEEAIYRGLVLRGLLGNYRTSRALLLSSVLFALLHVNPWQMPSAFVGGLILGWAYVRTRSLGLCIAGHALHNAIWYFSASLPFVIPGINSTPALGQPHVIPWWLALCGLVLVVVGATWFHRSAPVARPFPSRPRDDVPALSPSPVATP